MCFSYYSRLAFHHLTSKSRHGTHSPHVYALLDRWVYNKGKVIKELNWSIPENVISNKIKKVLLRILPYYNIQNVICLDTQNVEFDYTKTAIIVARNVLKTNERFFLENFVSKGGIIIWYEMYIDKRRKREWYDFVSRSCVTLSLDFFHFGFAYQRVEQHSERFRLKYPYFY